MSYRAEGCLKRFVEWVIDRTGAREFTDYVVPRHALHPLYSLGGLATLMFAIQAVTGIILLIYYVPIFGDNNVAYESVRHLTEEVPYGFLVRGLHSYSANLMIILAMAHFLRVYVMGAYAKPRELTYLTGIAAGLLAILLGVIGYSLRMDHIAAEAIRIGLFLTSKLPGGNIISPLIFGSGTFDDILPRYLAFHVGLAGLLGVILLLHFYMIHAHHIAPPYDGSEPEPSIPFFPNHLLTEAAGGIIVIGALVMFASAFPAELGYKFSLTEVLPVGQPEWFMMSIYALIKTGIDPVLAGLVIPAVAILILVLMPWIDPLYSRHPLNRRIATTYLLIFVGEYIFFLVYGLLTPGQQIPLINALILGTLVAVGMGAIGVKLTSVYVPPRKEKKSFPANPSPAVLAFIKNFHWIAAVLLVIGLGFGGYAFLHHFAGLYYSAAFYLGASIIFLGWTLFAAKIGLYDVPYLLGSAKER